MSEASLEVNTRYRNDLEEEKARLLKDMDRLKGKVTVGNSATLWQSPLFTLLMRWMLCFCHVAGGKRRPVCAGRETYQQFKEHAG